MDYINEIDLEGSYVQSSEMESILDYCDSNSIIKPASHKLEVIDGLIMDLKSVGIWNKLDVFYLFSGDSANTFKRINMKNPTAHYAGANGTLTWANDGVAGDGSTGWIDTNYISDANGVKRQLGDASIFGVMTYNGGRIWGCKDNLDDALNSIGGTEKRIDGYFTNQNRTIPLGFVCIVRDGASSGVYYDSGITLNLSGGTNSLTTKANTIHRMRNDLYGSSKLACWGTGGALSSDDVNMFKQMFNKYSFRIGLGELA